MRKQEGRKFFDKFDLQLNMRQVQTMSENSIDKSINIKNWSVLVMPKQLVRDSKSTDTYGKFSCEPLERGFGTTIGNALRRVLLSSLQGAAIVSVQIVGIQHEFSTIPGVVEDVTDIILNLKQVRFAVASDEPQRLELVATKAGEVFAGNIKENQNVKVLNKDLLIATLTDNVEFRLELEVRVGKGYVPADMHEGLDSIIGLIPLDASFSPVKKVAYRVEPARVGQMTNYDKLVLEVYTDGSVSPEDAIAYSAKILKEQLSVFINFDEDSADVEKQQQDSSKDVNPLLFKSIDDLELPVRAANCLKGEGIAWVGELVQYQESEIMKMKNFGRKSLEDIREVLGNLGLDFGMKIDNFDALRQEWIKKKDEDDEA